MGIRVDMHIDMCNRHVCGHVCVDMCNRHVCGHVCGHVYWTPGCTLYPGMVRMEMCKSNTSMDMRLFLAYFRSTPAANVEG